MIVKSILSILRRLKAYGWRGLRRKFNENNRAHVEVLSIDPNVILITASRNRANLHKRLKDKSLLLFLRFSWAVTKEDIPILASQAIEEQILFPGHRIIALCNEEWQVSLFLGHGLDAIFVSSNAFVDESVFQPIAKRRKMFAAVHNATMAPYKRHELASKISSLMIITYFYEGKNSVGYEQRIRALLSNAYWVNDEISNGKKSNPVSCLFYIHNVVLGCVFPKLKDRCLPVLNIYSVASLLFQLKVLVVETPFLIQDLFESFHPMRVPLQLLLMN